MSFFASDQSTGASSLAAFTQNHHETATVDITTLDIALREYGIEQVRLLKIDAEGFDKHVLEGFPWDRTKPAAIMCEFEDRKTKPLGYTTADMADLLAVISSMKDDCVLHAGEERPRGWWRDLADASFTLVVGSALPG